MRLAGSRVTVRQPQPPLCLIAPRDDEGIDPVCFRADNFCPFVIDCNSRIALYIDYAGDFVAWRSLNRILNRDSRSCMVLVLGMGKSTTSTCPLSSGASVVRR